MDSNRKPSRTWSLSRRSKDHTPIKLTPEEKRRTKISSAADPSKAITEEEPFAVSQTKPSAGLRGYQYKDIYGNIIAEPDLSNPTRSRWERPLDTIRSFEAQINMDVRRQTALYAVDTIDSMGQTRKHSQHNPGPSYPSLYYRNQGAQRHALVDAYETQRNTYYRHNSQDSIADYGRPMMSAARSYGDRWSPSRTPPLVNPYTNRSSEQQSLASVYLDGRTRSIRNRPSQGDFRRYNQGYQQYGSSTGSAGHDSYNYNSDPASESSSVGSHNAPPPPPPVSKEYQNIFTSSGSIDSNQLNTQPSSLSSQLDRQGYLNSNGYANGLGVTQVNENRYASSNPFANGNVTGQQPNEKVYSNGRVVHTGDESISRELHNQSYGTSLPGKSVPAGSNNSPAAPTIKRSPTEKGKKKRGLFSRFSKS